MGKRVLLLNPPGDKIYIRDYYCSKVSKASYVYEPPDLLFASALLHENHELKVLDAIASGLAYDEALDKAISFEPDVVFFISGSVSYKSDFKFLAKLKEETNALMIGNGDIFMADYEKRLMENDFLDAVVLDFTDPSYVDFIEGQKPASNMAYKVDGEVIVACLVRDLGGGFSVGLPRHDLFPLQRYKYPFVRSRRFATVLTDFGCPYRCRFCIMSQIGFKLRPVGEVVEELKFVRSLGVSEVYFDDQTFGAKRDRTLKLLDEIIAENLNLGWVCFSRVDVVDEELLMKMREAGCHTIMFGVESGNSDILEKYAKGISLDQVRKTFTLCKKYGIRTVATFLLGLPEDGRESIEETIDFALSCGVDYASFNIAVPRLGTPLRQEAISAGLVSGEVDEMDQSGSKAVIRTQSLSPEQVEKYKNQALKRFYFRPSFIFRELLRIRSLHDMISHVDGLMGVVTNMGNGRQ